MSIASHTVVSPSSLRRAGTVLAALALALALLAGRSGGTARAQSQCYNSNSGSSCTNYSSTGTIASTSTCTSDEEDNSVCITSAPNAPSTYSVCTNGACTSYGGTAASSVKQSVTEASWNVPSISWQPCNVPGKGMVWEKSQTITGRTLNC